MQGQTLKKIESSLKARGERFTAPRARVMAAILAGKGPLKAYDIVEKVSDMKPMSVYRALDFLSQMGLVHRIESLNAYVSCAESHCEHKDSQYLICEGCGSVEELHNHDIDRFIDKNLKKSGFQVTHKSMELHGRCTNCA